MGLFSKLLRKTNVTIIPDNLHDVPKVTGEFGRMLWFFLYTRRVSVVELQFGRSKDVLAPRHGFTFKGSWTWEVINYNDGSTRVFGGPVKELSFGDAKTLALSILSYDPVLTSAINSWWLEGIEEVFSRAMRNFNSGLEYLK